MDDGSGLGNDPQELGTCIEEAESRIGELEHLVAVEIAKMEKYRVRDRSLIKALSEMILGAREDDTKDSQWRALFKLE